MLYIVRKIDEYVACFDAARDCGLSFHELKEQLFCIGGLPLYNFESLKEVDIKLTELYLKKSEYAILNFEELLEFIR